MTQRPSIALLTCLWRRWPLTGLVLAHYADLRESMADRLTLELVCVGSEGDVSRTAAEAAGAHYLEHDNLPLGAKFNAGLTLARSLETEAVLIAGSDDLADVQLLERYRCGLVEGARFMGLRDMYFLDLRTRRLCFWPGVSAHRDCSVAARSRTRSLIASAPVNIIDVALARSVPTM